MRTLKRFVAGSNIYYFPVNEQVNYFDNFSELLTMNDRLPGAHGGFDNLGDGRGLSEIGTIRVDFWLKYPSLALATSMLDDFHKMQAWGVGRLFMQPTDPTASERFCWVRWDNPSSQQDVHELPHEQMKVSATFSAPDPFWLSSSGITAWGAGSSVTWGGGSSIKWGGGSVTTYSGLTNTVTLTNNGNTFTQPTISIRPDTGQTCTNPIIRRIVNGTVVDEVSYNGTLGEGDHLFIDCRKAAVTLNGVVKYDLFDFKHPAWLRLEPGDNSLQIRFAHSTDAAKFKFNFYHRYV